MMNNLRIVFAFLVSFVGLASYAQLNMRQFIDVNLGETYIISKPRIQAMFSQKPKIMKADFLGAAYIEFENVPFDYFGNCTYIFEYVKDTLVALNIEFYFYASQKSEFKRLFNTLSSELMNFHAIYFIDEESYLDSQKEIFQYIDLECKNITGESELNNDTIKMKHFGENRWSIGHDKMLLMNVLLGETHIPYDYIEHTPRYDGGKAEINLELTSLKLLELKNKKKNLSLSYITSFEEQTQIDLKFQDGVYLLPVIINDVLKIDFVLDLGASDVSISNDLFLVLNRTGTIDESDFIGKQEYMLADGSVIKSNVINLKTLRIGDIEIKNVIASISNNLESPLLFGQSALKKLPSYRIDNQKNKLIIE